MKKIVLGIVGLLSIGYLAICSLLYFQQESLIFFPRKLAADYEFQFELDFDDIYIQTKDSIKLHGLLFHSEGDRGLIFYLHGNSGGLDKWGRMASNYTDLGFDIFILDYRGYGKSEGEIYSEEQFFSDVQAAYDKLKTIYHEDRIVIVGYSIGTGSAAMLAANNKARHLVLQAPYFSLIDLMERQYPIVPTSLLNYKFETAKYIQKVSSPILIFHGDKDRVIYHGSSVELAKLMKPSDKFITLEGMGHNGINDDPRFHSHLDEILRASASSTYPWK